MSIQPNRIVNRIVQQVDQSDWPRLESLVYSAAGDDRWLRIYHAPSHSRYATAIHFWVHALREELTATGCRSDLVGAAGHALGRKEAATQWLAEFSEIDALPREFGISDSTDLDSEVEVYRMLESECRQSSVLSSRSVLIADFWGHGGGPSWRRRA